MSNETSLVGTCMYLPVTVTDELGDDNVLATYKSCTGAECHANILTDSLISPRDVEVNGTKAYHAALNAFKQLDCATCEAVWGCRSVSEAVAIPFEEFMQMYQSVPDTGSVWVSIDERLTQVMLVLYCRDAKVHCVNIGSHHYSIERIGYNEFIKNFSPNGDTCESLPVILKEVSNVENVLSLFKEMLAAKNGVIRNMWE